MPKGVLPQGSGKTDCEKALNELSWGGLEKIRVAIAQAATQQKNSVRIPGEDTENCVRSVVSIIFMM
jgi:hypothetical protein